MKIAVEGCCHGELDKIYRSLQYLEKKNKIKVDLLLICGDFQAVRNRSDLSCMAVPLKYQKLNTFYKYYSGEKKAPVLTIVVGGNHEASNYMQELPYGGWLAPNIYYLGYAGVVNFGGVRIAGISGIFKGKDFNRGHHERVPYTQETVRSAYHLRQIEVFRLKQLRKDVDIFMSHDWPSGVWTHGNQAQLLRKKPYFKQDIDSNSLGAKPLADLVTSLKPRYWFAAHLHCKFAANWKHENGSSTKFLALDKCLPRRQFLQVIDVPGTSDARLELDGEWLCVLKATDCLVNLANTNRYLPGPGGKEKWDYSVSEEELQSLTEDFGGNLSIPENFCVTAPAYPANPRVSLYVNEQTSLICSMLGVVHPNALFTGDPLDQVPLSCKAEIPRDPVATRLFSDSVAGSDPGNVSRNPDEIDLDSSDSEGEQTDQCKDSGNFTQQDSTTTSLGASSSRPSSLSDAESVPASSTPFCKGSRLAAVFENPIEFPDLPLSQTSEKKGEMSKSEEEPEETVQLSGKKPFKRRNQALYSESIE